MEVILPILIIAIVSNLVSGFVKKRISIPVTEAAVRALVCKWGGTSDELLMPRRLWIAAGVAVYTGWAVLLAVISLLIEWGLLLLLVGVPVCLLTGIYYGNKLYSESIRSAQGAGPEKSPLNEAGQDTV